MTVRARPRVRYHACACLLLLLLTRRRLVAPERRRRGPIVRPRAAPAKNPRATVSRNPRPRANPLIPAGTRRSRRSCGTHVAGRARRAAAEGPVPIENHENPMVCGRVDARARHGPFDTTGRQPRLFVLIPHSAPPASRAVIPFAPHTRAARALKHYDGMHGMRPIVAPRRAAPVGSSNSPPPRPQPCKYASAAVSLRARTNFSAHAQ